MQWDAGYNPGASAPQVWSNMQFLKAVSAAYDLVCALV